MKITKFKVHNSKSQDGVTLVEVIITLFLIAVVLILYAASLNVVAMTKKLRYENIAYHIATKQMEALRNTTFASLPASGSISDTMLTQLPSGAGSYATVNHASFTGMKEITVTVTWNDNVAKSVVLKTLAGTGGINP